jgi:hypothetical protein
MRFVVSRFGLEPFDQAAREFLERRIDGEPLEFEEPPHERDMHEHRRIMATIGDLAKALHSTPEKIRAELLIACGQFVLLDSLTGGLPVVAINSMSRQHMTDHELREFWRDAREVIQNKLLDRIPDMAERERLADSLSLQSA